MSHSNAPFLTPRPAGYEYRITIPSGTYKVTTDKTHDDRLWPHHIAQKLRDKISDEDLNTIRNGVSLIAAVVSVGGTAYTWQRGRKIAMQNKEAVKASAIMHMQVNRIEELLAELLKRGGHL